MTDTVATEANEIETAEQDRTETPLESLASICTVLAIGLFVMSYIGIAISLWPMIVPYRFTLWQAASSVGTQAFLLVGTLFLLPIILMYTGWSYWVFRGKVRGDIGYH